jgi:hypothetical protein
MRIVRPYGQSVTRAIGSGRAEQRRLLRLREALHAVEGGALERDLIAFAGTHDALVIAQWISTIDKIATKPRGSKRPTAMQRDLRQELGEAAWAHLVQARLLPGLDGDGAAWLEKLWRFKVHPYPDGLAKPERTRDGRPKEPPSPRGRWYARFAGDVEPAEIDAAAVVQRIHEHLHVAAYRMALGRPVKRLGQIEARARSIAGNVPRPDAGTGVALTWTTAGDAYVARVGNIAEQIREAALAREAGEDGAGTRRVGPDVAARVLHAAWADLFDGSRPSFEEARQRQPELVALHEAIRDRYSRTLKRHGKDRREHRDQRRQVSDLLPRSMPALFALLDATARNRDLAGLVRLGKVIHYEAAARAGGSEPGDAPAHVLTHWPTDVRESHSWTSDGQAAIKRNEAFVRIWRHGLALARQTLTDWADPKGTLDADILLAAGIDQATSRKRFDPAHHERKLNVLLGSRASLFIDGRSDDFRKGTLRLALEGIAQLRHNAFHFNGLAGFTQALRLTKPKPTSCVPL